MTDRELLELAAKASSMALSWHDWGDFGVRPMAMEIGSVCAGPVLWNPLTDDGDALRLAANLKIDIEWQSTGEFPEPTVEAYRRNPEGSYFCPSAYEDDYRRVIVEVAANIGKAMP